MSTPDVSLSSEEAVLLAEQVIPKLTVEEGITPQEFRNEVQEALMHALSDAAMAGNSKMVREPLKNRFS